MNKGQKILQLRKERGFTQKQLAQDVGVVESAIRNYERGIRSPDKRDQEEGIAAALGVDPEAIGEQREYTVAQAMHALFVLEDDYGIRPQMKKSGAKLSIPDGCDLSNAVERWAKLRDQLDGEEIDIDEYDRARDAFFLEQATK